MAENDKAIDPNAKLAAYTYPNAAADDAIVKMVEMKIAMNFPVSYTVGLVENVAKAPIDKAEIADQRKEYDQKVAQARIDHPDDVKKEEAEGPPPKEGAAVHPSIPQHSVQTSNAKGPSVSPKPPAKGEGGGGKGHAPSPPERLPSPPSALVLTGAASGDMNLDKWLDGYPNKSKETKEQLGKIKEMGSIANGFNGQVEGYVKKGSGFSESAKSVGTWFAGKKELGAAFGDNPYQKVQGGLGLFMQGISRFQNVVSIVGNIAGKIGMILTIVGLLAMILVPLGALIESVARILNIVGIICDVIGLVLSGILVGLNGVVLAQQIAKGGSNEEKAATADNMMTEANSAGGHILSLAMTYGPGFMKGLKGASKGVVGQFFAKWKGKIGAFIAKETGPVVNWAKNAAYKMGFGLENSAKAEGAGMLSKVWKSPEAALSRIRDNKWVAKFNNSGFSKGAGNLAAKIDNTKWANSVEKFGENMGTKVGKLGENSVSATENALLATEYRTAQQETQRLTAAENAGNREAARIDRDVDKLGTKAGATYDKSVEHGFDPKLAAESEKYADQATGLMNGKDDAVMAAEIKGSAAERKAQQDAAAAETKAAKKAEDQEKLEDKFKEDPKAFQAETQAIESTTNTERATLKAEIATKKGELKIKEADINAKLLDKTTTEAEKKTLLAERDTARAEFKTFKGEKNTEISEKLHELDERRLVPLKASGGESAEHLWDAKKLVGETMEHAQLKDGNAEKAESTSKWIEKDTGHAKWEGQEKAAQHNAIGEWTEHATASPTAVAQADALLEGLDEDLAHEDADGGGDEGGGDADGGTGAGGGSESGPAQDEPAPAPIAATGGETDGGGGGGGGSESTPAPAPAPAPAPTTQPTAAPPEGGGLPPLLYWPALAGPKGDFAKAAEDLTRMKQYAYAFQKSQVEAKKKAIEAYQTFLTSGQVNKLREAEAKKHETSTHSGVAEVTAAAGHAAAGTQKTEQGEGEQNKGKGNANGGAAPAVDPGEKPGLLHPIKRIWWYVKRWASEKAAMVFGWIQEKIASLVLQGICGVSMGELKQYTAALHRRMDFSKGVGTQGAATAANAADKNAATAGESNQYAQDAFNDAQDCDRNIADADAFMKNVEVTEQQVAAEQARATAFIKNLKDSVDAEKAKLADDKAKEKAAAAVALAASKSPAGPTTQPSPVATATPAPAASRPRKAASPGQKKVSSQAVSKVHGAALYVVNQSGVVVEQLTTSRAQQFDKLKAAVAKQSKAQRAVIAKSTVGEGVVTNAKDHIALIKTGMDQLKNETPATAVAARAAAGKIKSGAHALDELATHGAEDLNKAFKSAYDSIKQPA